MKLSTFRLTRPVAGLALAAVILMAAAQAATTLRAGEEGRAIPAPAVDSAPGPAASEIAVLAGGCFWGVQGVYQHLNGVTKAVSGYAGGDARTAQYERVGSGVTGHAEAVQVTFDPRKVSFGKILQVYFSVAHDPTELNRQGPDVGSQYRSEIFAMSDEQMRVAKAYIAQLDQARVFGAPIVTKVETGHTFYPAEAYHQDFLTLNPTYPYIVINDLPKIEALKKFFPALYRSQPVLVNAVKSSR
jgi:peptide-methionine (S)-S-oxide reductase